MAIAASADLLTMKIPNRLCLALAVGYCVLAAFLRVPPQEILVNLSCGAAMLALAFGLFSLGWIGGGDAKLASATALWLGWGSLLDYGLTAAVYGGVLTVILILGRRANLPHSLARQEWIARLHNPASGVPYGIALAAAGLVIYPQTEIWRRFAIG
jgi:prepilin peptidase CpaA